MHNPVPIRVELGAERGLHREQILVHLHAVFIQPLKTIPVSAAICLDSSLPNSTP